MNVIFCKAYQSKVFAMTRSENGVSVEPHVCMLLNNTIEQKKKKPALHSIPSVTIESYIKESNFTVCE